MKYSWTILILCFLFGCQNLEEAKNLESEKEKTTVRSTYYLTTVVHDEHLFILSRSGYFIHHINCPCQTSKIEQKEEIKPPTIILDLIRSK